MIQSKAIIDAIVEDGESKRRVVSGTCTEWRKANGKLHRLNGPAIEWKSGAKEWWVDGKLHRLDGPAREFNPGKEWWVNGALHRTDGPAKMWASGHDEWYVNGIRLSDEEFDLYVDQTTGEVFVPPGKKLQYST